MEIKKIDKKEIIEEIKQAGYVAGQSIDYEGIQKLYKQYGKGLKEVDFAQSILGIKYANYKNCKQTGTKVRILKSEELLSEEKKKEIIEEIKEAGYIAGQLINYEEIQKLYKQYGRGLKEVDFAQNILGITYINYETCKHKGTKVRILKSEEKILSEEEKKEIIEEIKQAGYIIGQSINYEEIQNLCKQYGRGLKEVDFAQNILGITYTNYNNCKNRGIKTRILKSEELLSEEKKKEIIEEIKEAGYVASQLINYEEIQNLCKRYGRGLKEVDFVQNILGITYANYAGCKNKGTKARILKSEEKILSKEEKKEIIEQIKQAGYVASQSINYEEIQNLCKQYGRGLKEVDFAQNILGITYANYNNCKNKGAKARILKSEEKILSKEEKKEIIEEIKEAGYIIGQSINYEEIQKLCKQYGRGLKEVDFAQNILGITYANYGSCKNKGTKARILKSEEKIEREEVDINEDEMNKCINLLKKYIEIGMSKSEAISETANEMCIDSETMIKYMQTYLLEKGRVKIAKGKIIPGEPPELQGRDR